MLPDDFIRLMHSHYEDSVADVLCKSLQDTSPVVSLRLNPFKRPLQDLPGTKVPWCTDACYLPERPAFTFDPLFHAGTYYVQEASSMFLSQVLRQYVGSPVVALDLCAAPGGKSTLLRSQLPEGSLLLCNEPIRSRAQVLAENMTKWGHPATVVTQNYPSDFTSLHHLFDLVVADVPCSGEGMFRKDEQAVQEWSLQNVDTCWRRQRDIIRDIWPALKPGGLMVYSTCTFNRYEDEDNVEWICRELGAHLLPVDTDADWDVVGQYHFLPGRTCGEGFFLALLRKDASEEYAPVMGKNVRRKSNQPEPTSLRKWVSGDFSFVLDGDAYVAFPTCHMESLGLLRQTLSPLVYGIQIAQQKGRDWVPSHALAMSMSYSSGTFPEVELDYQQAIAYLRRESIQIDAPKGMVIVTFRGHRLGFVKNLGNRANNLYPQEWRIRSSYTTPFTLC